MAFDHSLRQQRVIKEFLPDQVARRDRSDFRVSARTGDQNRDIFNEGLRSFISEARLLASLDHPNVVRVYRCLEANGTAYLVMHYYVGQTLKQRIEALDSVLPDADWVIQLLARLLRGLHAIHEKGILHRDIKPDNIYLLVDDQPVLIDFGAARRVIGGRTKALTGVITEGYSPIEQYAGDGGLKEGPWTDLYALGATLYLLVSGRKPWNAVMRLAGDPLQQAVDIGQANYPTTLLTTIDRALAIQPKERYQSAAEWLAGLEHPTLLMAEDHPQDPIAARRHDSTMTVAAPRTPTKPSAPTAPTTTPTSPERALSRDDEVTAKPSMQTVSLIHRPVLAEPRSLPQAADAHPSPTAAPITIAPTSPVKSGRIKIWLWGIIFLMTLTAVGIPLGSYLIDQVFVSPETLYWRGENYRTGRYSPKDLKEALYWLRRAAEKDHAAALYVLGKMYQNGEGVARDYAQAENFYRRSAALGYPEAQSALAKMSVPGRSFQPDRLFNQEGKKY
ncbi:MAG: protein kinase [Candidatus Competibacteraceae bacterium]|nr:protein kinase [Candidatus Competibacteraceae bacterium]